MKDFLLMFVFLLVDLLFCVPLWAQLPASQDMQSMQENPLLRSSELPLGAIPFNKIRNEHFMPAFEVVFDEVRARIEEIAEQTSAPTFENTLVALEGASLRLDQLSAVFFNMHSALGSVETQEIAKKVSVQLSDFENDLYLNSALFARIEALQRNDSVKKRSRVDRQLLRIYCERFLRNGARLEKKDKLTLRKIDKRIAYLEQLFSENLLKATDNYQLHITSEEDLKGLPENTRQAAAKEAKAKDKPGWIFTLRAPSVVPFVRYAERRALRKKILTAYSTRAQGDSVDNRPVLREIAKLRYRRAKLLGYSTHADYVLEQRMAGNPTTVRNFLRKIENTALPYARREVAELEEYAKQLDSIERLQHWDISYYMEKYRAYLSLDDELLKPYFLADEVLRGVFMLVERLYDLRFLPRKDLPVYHKDVDIFEVQDKKGNYKALLYVDLFSRKGKRNGAWMSFFQNQYKSHRPQIAIVCNLAQGVDGQPSLLTFSEVETLFHEFGHALHGILSNVEYASLSGTNVYWDFVEVPSQLMENWLYEKECLNLFAKHYKTGELLPIKYVERLSVLKRFMAGYLTIRQLTFGQIDMAWHDSDPTEIEDIRAFEKKLLSPLELFPPVMKATISTSFSHIFSGSYSAGYYSYKWAEMIEADAFEYFKSNGKTFDKRIARRFYEEVLEKGGSEPADVLYHNFRGKEPDPTAFLRRAGLLPQ